MTWPLIMLFGVGISMLLGAASVFYSRATTARRSALFLARVGTAERQQEIDLLGSKPTRLAKSKKLQELLMDAPMVGSLAELLEQSGLKTTVAQLLVQVFVAGTTAMFAGKFFGLDIAPALFLGFAGCSLPLFYVGRARALRALAFEAQLPQALELIGLYLRSGRSLPQAFIGATEELTPPASEEFTVCAEEYRLGRPLEVSLKRLASKYPTSIGFRLFAIAVSVLGQTGGNLVEVLERIKKTLDAGVKYGLRLKALTGESRLSAWILGFLPGFFMVAAASLNPSYFNAFFDNSLGRILFSVFLGLWGLGIVWIRQLMQSKAV